MSATPVLHPAPRLSLARPAQWHYRVFVSLRPDASGTIQMPSETAATIHENFAAEYRATPARCVSSRSPARPDACRIVVPTAAAEADTALQPLPKRGSRI